jgi:transglutaminase-like putative cysteine protease
MSIKEQLTLASGLAVALASAALYPLFSSTDWVWRVLGSVLVVVVAGLLGRRLGLPRPLQPALGVAFLLGYLCLAFAGDTLSYGLVPTGRTVDVLQRLVDAGRSDVQRFAPPVPATTGLVLLSAAGVGAVTLLVDLLAVVLDRAAVAGLPLLLLFAVPSSVLPGGLGGFPFVLGAMGWLGLLLVEGSERVGRWGTPMRSSLPGARPGGDESSLGRVGRRIGFAAVGMAVMVPLLVPGLDHRLVGGSGGDGVGSDGGSNSARTFNPITKLGDQLRQPKPVQLLQYRTSDPEPDYLRMTTLDRYTRAGWEASEISQLRRHAQVQKGIKRPVGDGGPHRDLTTTVQIDGGNLDVRWLPVPFGPTKVKVQGIWLWDPSSQTVFSASRTTKNLDAYVVQASRVLPDRNALALAEASGIDPTISEKYGDPIKVSSYVAGLTNTLVKDQTTEYDKAVALQSYFTDPRNHFVYDLNASQPINGQEPLEAFLRGRHGFCEQYASAMAAMLRVAGIPSRVAVGFTKGALLKDSKDTYSVTTSDAHAWPEAWFPGTGWVRFEPTPSAGGATVPDYSIPVTVPVSPDNHATAKPTPSVTPNGPNHRPERSDLLRNDSSAATPGSATEHGSSTSPWIFAPFAVLLVAVLPFLLTLVRRRRRWSQSDALTAWAQLEDDARDVGHRWHEADSPRAATVRLTAWRTLPPPALEALDRIAVAVERVRYAPPGRQVQTDLAAEVAVVRSALHSTSSTPVRLRAKLCAPSTLLWVAHGSGEWIANVLDTIDDVIAAITRPVRSRAGTR